MSPAVAGCARPPENVPALLARHPTREHEQMVREAVQIGQCVRAEECGGGDCRPLRPPDHCTGEMQFGAAAGTSGQNEAAKRLQILVHCVDLALEPVDLV